MTAHAAGRVGDAHRIASWNPEDEAAWAAGGSRLAWLTMAITTANLVMAFVTWFLVSVIVVKLGDIGMDFSTRQLFWLTAMPGLAGGSFRIVHTFLLPVFKTRRIVSASTLLLLVPLLGWSVALQHSGTPYWLLMVLAFLVGLGGGNFSSFMPSTNLFFPKRLAGTALGLQAGIGNFGVSLVQFVTPWVIGFSVIGAAQHNTKTGNDVWLQNGALVWIPFVVVLGLAAWIWLRDVPVHANVREQTDIFRLKHTWVMTSLYIMTFGSFAGFSAIFPLLIKNIPSNRIAWGSNCPASAGTLKEMVTEAKSALACLPQADQDNIFAKTAQKLYPALAD